MTSMQDLIDQRFTSLTTKHRELTGAMLLGHDVDTTPSSAELNILMRTKYLQEYRLSDAFFLATEAGSIVAQKLKTPLITQSLIPLEEKAQKYLLLANEHKCEIFEDDFIEHPHPTLSALALLGNSPEMILQETLYNSMAATLGLYETALDYYEQLLSHKNVTEATTHPDEAGMIMISVNEGLTVECENYRKDYQSTRALSRTLNL